MPLETLTVAIDHGDEPRVWRDHLAFTVPRGKGKDGSFPVGWDLTRSENFIQDAETKIIIRKPRFTDEAFRTTHTGDYEKISRAVTSVAAADEWLQDEDYFFISRGTEAIPPVETIQVFPQNQGYCIELYLPGNDQDLFPHLMFTFGGYKFVLWSDSTIEMFFADTDEFWQSKTLTEPSNLRKAEKAQAGRKIQTDSRVNRYFALYIIPAQTSGAKSKSGTKGALGGKGGGDQLWFRSSKLGAANFTVPPKEEGDPSTAVTSSSTFKVTVLNGQAKFRLSRIQYYTDAFMVSDLNTCRQAIEEDAPNDTYLYFDSAEMGLGVASDASVSLVEDDLTTPFVPDGIKTQFRIRVDFGGSAEGTEFIIGASTYWPPYVLMTNGEEEFTADGSMVSCRMSIPKDYKQVRMDVTLKNVPELDVVLPRASVISDRPIKLQIGDTILAMGSTKQPKWNEEPDDDLSRLQYQNIEDWVKTLNNCIIEDPIPYDLWLIEDMIIHLFNIAGFDISYLNIEAIGLQLDLGPEAAAGNWNWYPVPGDKVTDWLDKVFEEFIPKWIKGWAPGGTNGYQFIVLDEQSIGDVQMNTVFNYKADADAAINAVFSYEGEDASQWGDFFVYNKFDATTFEPECNVLRYTGFDYNRETAIQVIVEDEDARDPSLLPSLRPDNWTGRYLLVGYFNRRITSYALLEWAANAAFDETAYPEEIVEIDVPQILWAAPDQIMNKGMPLAIYPHGIYRLDTIDAEFVVEDENNVHRPSHYLARFIKPYENVEDLPVLVLPPQLV